MQFRNSIVNYCQNEEEILKRSLQKYPNFSKRTLKERNLAFIASANFAKRFIQSSLKGELELDESYFGGKRKGKRGHM